MDVKEYLDKVAYIECTDITGRGDIQKVYRSKFDKSYIIHVGLERYIKFLADREITEQLIWGAGFSPKYNTWYGWSSKAIHGFTIGSTCKKGDYHYIPSTVDELFDYLTKKNEYGNALYDPENVLKVYDFEDVLKIDGGVEIHHKQPSIIGKDYNGNLIVVNTQFIPVGRGEYTIKTMDEAKQLAIDFSKRVI